MLINKYWQLLLLILTFLLVPLSSVLAAHTTVVVPRTYFPTSSPSEVRLNLLNEFINKYNPCLTEVQKQTVCNSILSEAASTGFDPFLISSVIAAESSFYPTAVSPCAALGLMQITSGVIQSMRITNPFDIRENIYAGTRYLKYLQGRFTDFSLILAAYNAGPTRVARLGRIPKIEETINYVRRVTFLYKSLQQKMQFSIDRVMIKPILCPVMVLISNRSIEAKPILLKKTTSASIQELLVDLCEADYSIRFFSILKKYSSRVLITSRGSSFANLTFLRVSFH